MASKGKQPVEEAEDQAAPAAEEEAEREAEQEAAQGEVEESPKGAAAPHRTGKARAPRSSDTAPAPRPRGASGAAPGRRRPEQLPLFSRLSSERLSNNAAKTGSSILISLLGIGLLVVLFHLFAGSRFFLLRGVDVHGNTLLTAEEVEQMIRPHVPRGVLNADLELVCQELEKYPLISRAEVARLLPDRLRVVIVERQPIALARRADGSVACVDQQGVMFGDSSHWRGNPAPPINGLSDDDQEKNRRWVMMYRRLMAELDQNEPRLSSRVDEIYFDQDEGVRLRLIEPRVAVLLGNEDFRPRLNAALDVLDAVRSQNAEALNVLRISDAERLLSGVPIAYLNATDPKRVIVGLDE